MELSRPICLGVVLLLSGCAGRELRRAATIPAAYDREALLCAEAEATARGFARVSGAEDGVVRLTRAVPPRKAVNWATAIPTAVHSLGYGFLWGSRRPHEEALTIGRNSDELHMALTASRRDGRRTKPTRQGRRSVDAMLDSCGKERPSKHGKLLPLGLLGLVGLKVILLTLIL